jgi:PAS domain S-box-containing protein
MNKPAIILIVDDIASNRDTLRELLEPEGYQIVEAGDGPMALRLSAETAPDLVLLDVMMPGMNGYDVCRRLRADANLAQVPVIIVTALDDQASRLAGLEAGADDFITKPFNRIELRARVRTTTRLNRYRRLVETQSALHVSEDRYRILFDLGPVAVYSCDAAGTIQEYNRRALELWGRRPALGDTDEQFCGSFKLYLPDGTLLPHAQCPMAAVLSGECSLVTDAEVLIERPDGSRITVIVNIVPLKNDNGTITGAINSFHDITERKKAEVKLRESEESYRDLFDNATDLILSVTPDGRFLYANRACHEILGYGAADLAVLTLPDLFHPNEREQCTISFNRAVEGRNHFIEVELMSKSGKRITLEGSISVKMAEGEVVSLRCILRDVTEKKKLEEQLLRNQRMESIGTLAGGVAHDLNNALAPILMSAQLLRMKINDPDCQHTLDLLEASAERGADMVKQVLTFARGIEGKHGTVQFRHLVKDMVSMANQTFPKTIQIKFRLAKDVWPVSGDATQLHQVILNLCVNARDAMPHGGILTLTAENMRLDETFMRIHSEAHPGPYTVLSVIDTGTGIPAHILERIFEPFFTTKEPGQGTGLGLSTVRSIVKNHNGFLTVETALEKGSHFRVYLPALVSESTAAAGAERPVLTPGHGECILVVDDESVIRDLARRILQTFGYEVLVASHGAEAVALCAKNIGKIHVMFTDMVMPIMDGGAAISAVRSIDPSIKIIVTSGSGLEAKLSQLEPCMIGAALQKPYTPEKLLNSIYQVIHRTVPPPQKS